MNKSRRNLVCALSMMAMGVVGVVSCKKSEGTGIGTTQNLQEFVGTFGIQKQVITFNTSELPKTFELRGGTKIKIPAGALRKNNVILSGEGKLEAYEVDKRSQLIISGLCTDDYTGAPLTSEAMMYLNVLVAGTEVDREVAWNITMEMPTRGSNDAQRIYRDTHAQGDHLMWALSTPSADNSVPIQVVPVDQYYRFFRNRLGWINVGLHHANFKEKSNLTVKLIDAPGNVANSFAKSGDLFVYFCPKGTTVATKLYKSAGENIVRSTGPYIPTAVEGRLVAFGAKDGQYYIAQKDITTATNMEESLTLIRTTEQDIIDQINKLNSY